MDINEVQKYYEKSTSRERQNEKRYLKTQTRDRRAQFMHKTKSMFQPNEKDRDQSENRKNTQIVSGRYIDYGDNNKLGLRKQSTQHSRSVNPNKTKEGKEIKIQKIYNNVDHESMLSGDAPDLKSILSSSKSPNPKLNTSRQKPKSRDTNARKKDRSKMNNNDSPFLRISDMGHSQTLMMGDQDILF